MPPDLSLLLAEKAEEIIANNVSQGGLVMPVYAAAIVVVVCVYLAGLLWGLAHRKKKKSLLFLALLFFSLAISLVLYLGLTAIFLFGR